MEELLQKAAMPGATLASTLESSYGSSRGAGGMLVTESLVPNSEYFSILLGRAYHDAAGGGGDVAASQELVISPLAALALIIAGANYFGGDHWKHDENKYQEQQQTDKGSGAAGDSGGGKVVAGDDLNGKAAGISSFEKSDKGSYHAATAMVYDDDDQWIEGNKKHKHGPTQKECECYCRSVVRHSDSIAQLTQQKAYAGYLCTIVYAVGRALTRCDRLVVSNSGIIAALRGFVNAIKISRSKSFSSHDAMQSVEELNPVYTELVQACIIAGHYRYAVNFIDDNPVYAINSSTYSVTAECFLRYFYLVGVVFCGCERWSDAVNSLKICITISSQSVSAIVIAAYKKLIFASLMSVSAKPILPQCTSTVVTRCLTTSTSLTTTSQESLSCGIKAYNEIADAFLSNDIPKLSTKINQYTKLLIGDGNRGLAGQLLDQVRPNIVRSIASVYETISLSKMAKKLDLTSEADVEMILLKMISQGTRNSENFDFRLKIDQENSYVHFNVKGSEHKNSLKLDEMATGAMVDKIVSYTRQCVRMAERVRNLDISLSTSAKFQSKTYPKQKQNKTSNTESTSETDTGKSVILPEQVRAPS